MASILLVDDDPFILKKLKIDLQDIAQNILLASSGEEALAILDQNKVDLIISDVKMEGMNGLQFLNSSVMKKSKI